MAHTHILGTNEPDTTELTKQHFLRATNAVLIDPIGNLFNLLSGVEGTKVLNFADTQYPIPINPLQNTVDKADTTDRLVETFLSVWQYGDFPATRVIDCLYNSISALLDYPDATLVDIKSMLVSASFRKRVLPHVTNTPVRSYWEDEFETLKDKERHELISSTRANIHQFIADPRLRHIFGYPHSKLEYKGHTVVSLAGLSRKKTNVIGSILLTDLIRHDVEVFILRPHLFTPRVLIDYLDRPDRSLTLTHRYLGEFGHDCVDAILGASMDRFLFRLSPLDGDTFESLWDDSNLRNRLASEMPAKVYRYISPEATDFTMPDDTTLKPWGVVSTQQTREKNISDSRRLYARHKDKVASYVERKFARPDKPQRKKGRTDLS